MDAWLADWESRIPTAGLTLADPLIDELADFVERHPEHFDPTWSPPVSRSVANDPNPGPVHRGMGSNVEQWRPLVAQHFNPGDVETAMCIMTKESGGNPTAKNPTSTAAGLFQFLKDTWNDVPTSITGGSYSSGAVYNPQPNVAAAAWLQDRYGWKPWAPYNRGLCRGL